MTTVLPEPVRVERDPRSPRRSTLWWTTPAGALLLVVPLSLTVALIPSEADYRFFYGTARYIDSQQALRFTLMAVMLLLGTVIPAALGSGRPRVATDDDATRLRVLASAERIAFRLAIVGYVLLGALGVARGARPADVISAVVSQSNDTGTLETLFAPVAGVTSLTQIGVAQVILAGLVLSRVWSGAVVRRVLILLVLALVRSFILTERLALLELAVPLLVIAASHGYRTSRSRLLVAAPVLALPGLAVFFGIFEYSRSWSFYRTHTDLSFPAFVLRRLAGYYATAYNNGAIEVTHRPPGWLPYNSIEAVWTAPGVAQLDLYTRLGGAGDPSWLTDLFQRLGNPEFNNPGGFAVPIVDFGVAGGAVYFLLAGLVIGLAHRSWQAGGTVGLLFYPLLFTGVLEIPRYVYWTQGRVVPAVLYLAITAAVVHRRSLVGLRGDPG